MSKNYKFHNRSGLYFVPFANVVFKYSSARHFQDDDTILEIDRTGFLGWFYGACFYTLYAVTAILNHFFNSIVFRQFTGNSNTLASGNNSI